MDDSVTFYIFIVFRYCLLIPSWYLGVDQYWYTMRIFIHLYTTGAISVCRYRLRIVKMSETKKFITLTAVQ